MIVARLWAGNAGPLALVGLLYLLTLVSADPRGLWTTDNAAKFLQVEAILSSGFTSFALPWPGRFLDPDFAFNPLPYHFSSVRGDELYSVFPPVFSFVSAGPYAAFGHRGLYLLPLLSSLLMLLGVARLTRALGRGRATQQVAVLLCGLGTPVWFYSVTFWEHCLTACLCIWALLSFIRHLQSRAGEDSRRHLLIGSAIASFAVYLRDDLYLFCAVLVLLTVWAGAERRWANALTAAAMMALCLLPFWAWQWQTMGNPLGIHITTHLASATGIGEHLAARPKVFYNQFIAACPIPPVSFFLTLPFLFLWLRAPRYQSSDFQRAMPRFALLCSLSALVSLIGYLVWHGDIDYLLGSSNSLFAAAPFAVMGFLRCDAASEAEHQVRRWLRTAVLVYAGLYGLAASDLGSSGVHWGNRYLLILYPIWAVQAAASIADWWHLKGRSWQRASLVLIVCISVGAQLFSVQLLERKKTFSARLNEFVRERPEQIVVTDERWAPHELFDVFYNKAVFYAATASRMDELMKKLRHAGFGEFLFLTQRGRLPRSSQRFTLEDEGLNWYHMKGAVGSTHRSATPR